MKLIYEIHKSWKPTFTNFGDELNLWIWPRLIGDLLDDDESVLLVGIGTVLDDTLPAQPLKVIFGAGNGYRPLPAIDESFRFYFVRGPLTAKALGLPASCAVTDPAVLIAKLLPGPGGLRRKGVVLMGHYTSAMHADWSFACRELGMTYIHPLWPWERVLESLRGAELVVAEAMHGAIVADALRVPWVPVITSASQCSFKWRDWTQSLGLKYEPIKLPALWDQSAPPASRLSRARRWIKRGLFLRKMTAAKLAAHTQLSSESIINARTDRLMEEVEKLKRDAVREGWVRFGKEASGAF